MDFWRAARWARYLFSLITAFLLFFFYSAQGEAAQETGDTSRILVLNYHKVDSVFHSLAIDPGEFDEQMEYLKGNGYHTITLAELYEAMCNGGKLPENPVLITFDDGYADNYYNAYPILKKHGFTGVIFLVTGFADQNIPGYVSWAMAKEMQDSGVIDIESHTVNHISMTAVSDEELRKELIGSKQRLEEKLGKPVEYVAYPTGTYNLHIANIVREAGYKGAFTIKYGIVDTGSNIYALERIPIFRTAMTHADFISRLQYVPSFQQYGWIKS